MSEQGASVPAERLEQIRDGLFKAHFTLAWVELVGALAVDQRESVGRALEAVTKAIDALPAAPPDGGSPQE
jgi:hypothetical protein